MKREIPRMGGKTCLVTGATGGIGRAAATALAGAGTSMVLLGRDRARTEAAAREIAAVSGNDDIDVLVADLSSQAGVRSAAGEFLASGRPLHVLLNNAGVVMMERRLTVDGIETTFAVNHLAYFLLTTLLLERLRESAPARVVCVASDAHKFAGGRLDFDDLGGEQGYGAMKHYGKSKLANILFVRELARRLDGTGVTVNCLHPGMVGTGLGTNNGLLGRVAQRVLKPFSRTPEKGAETAVWLCSSPDVDGASGGYYSDLREISPNDAGLNDDDARQLWDVSLEMTALAS